MYLMILKKQELDEAHAVYKEKIQQVHKIIMDILASKRDVALERWEADSVFEQISEITQKKLKS
jgi:hypothetical protein